MVGIWTSKIVLKIRCKSFSGYLRTKNVVAGMTVIEKFAPRHPAGWFDNLSPNSGGDKEKSKKETEGRFLRGRPWL